MNRLDRFLAKRILSRIAGVVVVFFGLICLTQALDTWVVAHIAKTQGGIAALVWIAATAARWSIKMLPVTVLIGGVLGVLSLQTSRELVAIKASGRSIWDVIRGPVLGMLVAGIIVAVGFDTGVTLINRAIYPDQTNPSPATKGGVVWLKQSTGQISYIFRAQRVESEKNRFSGIDLYFESGAPVSQIHAETAELTKGRWTLADGIAENRQGKAIPFTARSVPTTSSLADLDLKLSSVEDFTLFELAKAIAGGMRDPRVLAAAETRYSRLISLPFLLVGTLLIAIAFSTSYRRSGSYGQAIIAGILLGFVVFVVNEMAVRAGAAGVITPQFAAWGPVVVANAIGLTVILFKEDGRV